MDEEQARVLAERIVFLIWRDLTDRRGLRYEWDAIGPVIKAEILSQWFDSTFDAIRERPAASVDRDSARWAAFADECRVQ